jgi:hypothetical protein
MTGVHVVADLACSACGTVVGWTYVRGRAWRTSATRGVRTQPERGRAQVRALDDSQRYKEGKSILESGRVLKHNGWDADG